MFHSIGMPAGLFSAMKPWKPVITTSAATVTSGSPLESSTIGIAYSVAVPMCAMKLASREGRRSSGYATKSRRLTHDGKKGPLFIITMITDGKWWLSFEVAAQNQMQAQISLHAEIQTPPAEAAVRQSSATK